jgi:hypothetical protein
LVSESVVCLRRRFLQRAGSGLDYSALGWPRSSPAKRWHVTRNSIVPAWLAWSRRESFCGVRPSWSRGLKAVSGSSKWRRVGLRAGRVPPEPRTFQGGSPATALGVRRLSVGNLVQAVAVGSQWRYTSHTRRVVPRMRVTGCASRWCAAQRRPACAIPAVRRRQELSNTALHAQVAGPGRGRVTGQRSAPARERKVVSRRRAVVLGVGPRLLVLPACWALITTACRDGGIYEQSSHVDFILTNQTGEPLLVHVHPHDATTSVDIGQAATVDQRDYGFTCDPAPASQQECLQIFTRADMRLAYQKTSNAPAPWTRRDLGRCRYRYELVLMPGDLGTVPDSVRCN